MTLRFYDCEDGVKVFLLFYPKPFPKPPGEAQHHPTGLPSQHFSLQLSASHLWTHRFEPSHAQALHRSPAPFPGLLPALSYCLVPIHCSSSQGGVPQCWRDVWGSFSIQEEVSITASSVPSPRAEGDAKGEGGAEKKTPPSPGLVRNDITSRL